MTVEVEVIKMITSGIIPKIIIEERTRLDQDLLQINAEREEECGKTLDLSKSSEHHFHEVELNSYIVDTEDRVEVDDKNFENTDDVLFGTKSDLNRVMCILKMSLNNKLYYLN